MSARASSLYTPFDAPYRLAMGLMALPEPEWFEVGDSFAAQLAEKRRLLAERPDDVFRSVTGSEDAQAAFRDAIFEHLPRCHPDLYCRDGDTLVIPALDERWARDDERYAPLDLAARWVQEDLCLMQPGDDDARWHLSAASVCFPTRWRLEQKIGRPLDEIHAPAPQLTEKLARPMARFFDQLKPGRGVWRLNWSVLDDPALFQPTGHSRTDQRTDITAENAGDRLWLRSERQTLRRLDERPAILFTIRIHVRPLRDLAAKPEAAARLAESLATMPDDIYGYKSFRPYGAALAEYLRRLAAHGSLTDK